MTITYRTTEIDGHLELHLPESGHFALEDHADEIAAHIVRFAGTTVRAKVQAP